MVKSEYQKAWEEYTRSESYMHSVRTLTNRTYTPKQPYINNTIAQIFADGYWSRPTTIPPTP